MGGLQALVAPRFHQRRPHGLWRAARAPQWKLRELSAQSALALARLIASRKDDNGRVLIRDFYAGFEPVRETPMTHHNLMETQQ
jgi:hypothetical protein